MRNFGLGCVITVRVFAPNQHQMRLCTRALQVLSLPDTILGMLFSTTPIWGCACACA